MDYSGNTCTAELHYVLHKNLMIRRLKADVLHELPAKRRQKIQIAVDDKIVKKILKILSEMGEPKDDEDEHEFYGINGMPKPVSFDDALDEMQAQQQEAGSSFGEAYRLTGEAKVAGTIEFLETLLEAGAKFLLFAHHQLVLDSYEQHLKKKKVGHIRIDGKVDPEKRHERVT